MEPIVVSLDVGTSKVRALVGHLEETGALKVLGVGTSDARGMRKGLVTNVEEVIAAISNAVEKAERVSGHRIRGAVVGISGSHIRSVNLKGIVAVSSPDRVIRPEDVERALEQAQASAFPFDQAEEILHTIPRLFTVDGQGGIRDPLGMKGLRLEVETHIILGRKTHIENLVRCVESLGIQVLDLILQPLASAEAVLTPEEREQGVVLVDIGGGTTDIAVFVEGNVWHSSVLPVGGHNMTRDVAIVLKIPLDTAEYLKLKYGDLLAVEAEDEEDRIEIPSFSDEVQEVSRSLLNQVLRARAEEIFALVRREVERAGPLDTLPAGVVLTGGGAQTPGTTAVAREILGLPVRIGRPREISGLVETLKSPAYATVIGLARWALNQPLAPAPWTRTEGREGPRKALWDRFREIVRQFFPS